MVNAALCRTQRAKIDAGKGRTAACLRQGKQGFPMAAGGIPGDKHYPNLGLRNRNTKVWEKAGNIGAALL